MNFRRTRNIFAIFALISLVISCASPQEQRMKTIHSLLCNEIENTDSIEIADVSYDSIYSTERNINHIRKVQKIVYLKDSALNTLNTFKSLYVDDNNRFWLKNLSDGSKRLYGSICENYNKLHSTIWELIDECHTDTLIGCPQQSIVLQYKTKDERKYGLFIFDDNYEIADYMIFSEEEYKSINNFLVKAQRDAEQYIPTFETVGIDIVPEDEDPSKSREERLRIKAEQEAKRQAEHRAYMKKINPIPNAFYGATLGRTSVNIILRKLRNEGWKVTQLSNGVYSEYYCSDSRDYIDGLSYNVIRVYARNGIFDKIEFIDDYTPEWDANKRYFGPEIESALRLAKSTASKNFGFWSQGYTNEKYDDGTTILTIEKYGNCVSYTFVKNDK